MARTSAADTSKPLPRKPLIFADDPLDGLDDERDALGSGDTPLSDHPSYIEGYSDVKRENALRIRDGLEPISIARAQWVRISKGGGENVPVTDEAMHTWRNLGYRAAGLDDLDALGWKMSPTAHVAADGTIRRGDLALFFVPAARAARNRREEAAAKAEAKQVELTPQHPVLSLPEDKNYRTVEHGTNPRKVLDAGIPQL